ncbi:transposase [Nodosilinea sp. P-1105]|uniref:REP-associated tyrosine transposase n=1 Tax=Nodosilinea sp. P-1105 TaxID=2546229 RepID=UPI00146C94BC|nr:transposase [Nodosilinea sp. P-1105]NMF83308.1 transposase [Nodosilinea sp. P-1105]
MPTYRRIFTPGGAVFLTLVTFKRQPIFAEPNHVQLLRKAVSTMKAEMPFDVTAAVILPDHIHFVWNLPQEDGNYSRRVGRLKILFTQFLRGKNSLPQDVGPSRQKHRESDVWKRRFWEYTLRDEEDWAQHLNYLHYNPVKHGLARCPHQWEYSSFRRFVGEGFYGMDWGCQCGGKAIEMNRFEQDLEVGA